MPVTLYGIPNCDTVKRARAWLAAQGAQVHFHDFKREGVPSAALERWLSAVGRARLVNRQGTSWRKLDASVQALAESDAGTRELVTQQVSTIKRPVVEWPGGAITVGFDEAAWTTLLKA